MPICPECQSSKVWKDGLRYVQGNPLQRYLCRECGYRFSESNEFSRKNIISNIQQTGSRQICVLDKKVKNLVRAETEMEALRESTQKHKGEIIQFGWHMQKRGLSEATIQTRMYRLNVLVKKGANLEDPETVETILAVSDWGKANKKIFANSYKAYCNYKKIEWQLPKITVPNKEPFLPLEEEVQQLVAGSGKKHQP